MRLAETPLNVLIVEDSEDDALLVDRALRRAGWSPRLVRVETEGQMREALSRARWDVVISDHALPAFSAPAALAVMKDMGRLDELPFIIVSGTMPDESAVEALRAGAGDFVSKQKLGRLGPAIDRELRDVALRRERREALEQLREAVRARDEFLSIASHELKTPLTSLRLQVQALARQLAALASDGDERLTARLGTIDRSTARIAELVNRLLDVSRLSAGALQLRRERLDLARVVTDAVGRLRERADAIGSPLRVEGAGAVGRWDRMRVESVVTNLLENAFKYGAGSPIDVVVREDGADVVLVVRDRGIGIAPEDHARIFERFERAAHGQFEGMGIGLWLARAIVEAHGGAISVESRPGSGATFTVRLPKEPPRVAHEEQDATP